MDQGVAYLRRSGARQYVERLGETAKNDPLPLAVAGLGLAWLMMSDRWARSSGGERTPRWAASMKDSVSSMADAAASTKHGIAQTSRKVSDGAHAMRERASRAADGMRERAAQAANTARVQADRVRVGYRHMVDEQPLALGAIGFAVGAVLAAVAPRTRQEDEVLGPARERVLNDLQQAARESLDIAASAASAGVDAAVQTVRKDLAPGVEPASQAAPRGPEWEKPQADRAPGTTTTPAVPPAPH
jgi:hypothetical protein